MIGLLGARGGGGRLGCWVYVPTNVKSKPTPLCHVMLKCFCHKERRKERKEEFNAEVVTNFTESDQFDQRFDRERPPLIG